jgi:class 3 adenylate cyclase
MDVHLIALDALLKHANIEVHTDLGTDTKQPEERPDFLPEVRALLFADAVGFSKLQEEQIPIFVKSFLGAISRLLKEGQHAPILRNTWGDGIYFVFATVTEAGVFALDLCEMVNTTDWVELGLPSSLNLRVGLHAGPVYACFDPILERPNYVGTHVSRAARIEPITPPGLVYASESFAALSAAEAVTSFRCEYVGQTAQAKGYGTFPTYVVRRPAGIGLRNRALNRLEQRQSHSNA